MSFATFYQLALKVLASGLLAWLAVLCFYGLRRIWSDPDLAYRNFAYTREGAEDAAAGLHFTQLVNLEIRRLHGLLSFAPGTDVAFSIPTVSQQGGTAEPLKLPSLPTTLLPEINIQAYGIQFSALVNRLFQQIVPPNEVVGTVTESKGYFNVYVELHQSGRFRDVPAASAMQHATKEDAAFATACRIYRMLATQRGLIYAAASDAEFEVFARALEKYQLYRLSLAEVRPSHITTQSLQETERLLGGQIEQDSDFPPLYKLAALVASSKGQTETAISYLELYDQMWPNTMPKDENASVLLAQYKEEIRRNEELLELADRDDDFDPKIRHRPVRPGISVSSSETTAGTICCVVRDMGVVNGPRYVLGPEFLFGSTPGTKIVQPGMADGGDIASDVIAEVVRGISDAGTVARLSVDAATGTPQFAFAGTATVKPGQTVRKVGRSTGVTVGTVVDVDVTIKLAFPDGIRTLSGLIGVQGVDESRFTMGGDGGAPVVDEQNRLIGMHLAGSPGRSFVIPIGPVLSQLGVELAPSPAPTSVLERDF